MGFVQAILYGFFVATWIYSLRWLIFEDKRWKLRSRANVNWLILTVTVLIFVLSTVDLGLTLRTTFALIRDDEFVSNQFEAASVCAECLLWERLSQSWAGHRRIHNHIDNRCRFGTPIPFMIQRHNDNGSAPDRYSVVGSFTQSLGVEFSYLPYYGWRLLPVSYFSSTACSWTWTARAYYLFSPPGRGV